MASVIQKPSGMWRGQVRHRGYAPYASGVVATTIDTGAALESQISKLSASELSTVLGFLRNRQNATGAFEAPQGDTLQTTAIVLRGLKGIVSKNTTAAALAQKSAAYLMGLQQSNGSWAGDLALSALVFEAIFPYTANKPEIAVKLKEFLLPKQEANGSWEQDAYVTSVVLRALQLTGETPANPLVPDQTGTVIGQIRHGVTQEALQNAVVTLQGYSANPQITRTLTFTATSDNSGRYTITGVPAWSVLL